MTDPQQNLERSLTCIVCPMGCSLNISADMVVTGNRCSRGAVYAEEELRSPKRVVTATCAVLLQGGSAESPRNKAANVSKRVPVKTESPCPKEKIPALLKDIYKTKVSLPVAVGDTIIADWNGEGIRVVATRNMQD